MGNRKWLLVIALVVFVGSTGFTQTVISEGNVSGVWMESESPYSIYGDITIPGNETLFIEPGCTIRFEGHYFLKIQGNIQAVGNMNDTIVFTCNQDSIDTGWKGIRFEENSSSDSSFLVCCKIEYGNASPFGYPTGFGGGVFIDSVSMIRIENCNITNNKCANKGGGICCSLASPVIKNNTFQGNWTYNYDSGGALRLLGSNSEITGNLFINNHSDAGGAIQMIESSPLITKNAFRNNNAVSGSALQISLNSSPRVFQNEIIGNSSLDKGAINISSSSNPIIESNLIVNNEGGTIEVSYSEARIVNNIICNNSGFNGSVMFFDGANCDVINNTIVNNYDSFYGHIRLWHGAEVNFYNNIIYNNSGEEDYYQIVVSDSSNLLVDHCNIENNVNTVDSMFWFSGSVNFSNNIDTNSSFTNPTTEIGNITSSYYGDWSLLDNSPCINTGLVDTSGLNLPLYDFIGNQRIYGDRIDIGAIENQNVVNTNYKNMTESVYLYPNPVKDILYICSNNKNITRIEIINSKGSLMWTKRVWNTNLNEIVELKEYAGSAVVLFYSKDGILCTRKIIINNFN